MFSLSWQDLWNFYIYGMILFAPPWFFFVASNRHMRFTRALFLLCYGVFFWPIAAFISVCLVASEISASLLTKP